MRCIGCNSDIKKKQQPSFSGRCPSCGHAFAITDPVAGLSDFRLKRAIEAVSDTGKLYYLPEQAGYEVMRRVAGRSRFFWPRLGLGLGLIGAGVWMLFAGWWPPAAIAVVLGFVAATNAASLLSEKPPEVFPLVDRFESINPPTRGVPHSSELVAKLSGQVTPDMELPADRALVCEDERMADFFLANDFHLHHACPVIARSGYPQELFPNLIERLRAHPSPSLFVIHNLSPAGLDFAREVRHDEQWFGGNDGASIVDLGLRPTHKEMVEKLLRPLSAIPGRHRSQQVPGLPYGMGAELSLFRPETLIAMSAAGIASGTPMVLPAAAPERDRGGWDSGSSE